MRAAIVLKFGDAASCEAIMFLVEILSLAVLEPFTFLAAPQDESTIAKTIKIYFV